MKCESTVYLNQVFYNKEAPSCPLPGELTADSTSFTQQLTFFDPPDANGCGCGCGCNNNCLEFSDDLNFVVESSQIFVTDFALSDPQTLVAANVTVNGIPVDTLTAAGSTYTAAIDTLMPQIENCLCLQQGASTQAMLLITGAGPWVAKMTVVVYGSVFGCGVCKKFKLVMTTINGVSIDIPGTSTFTAPQLCLPCVKGGTAPVIRFSFLANASLLNPVITTDTGTGPCNVILTGTLITEPAVQLQVTRETLFAIDGLPVPVPCDDLAKCAQAPGSCTCAADFPPPENPCCNDACGGPGLTGPGSGSSSGSGNCECGCGCGGGPAGAPAGAGAGVASCGQQTQICCQFNGINGCSL